MNEGLTSSTCSLSNLSLSSTCLLTIVVTGIGIIKVWTCKNMILKPIPPLSGLIGLVMAIGYTTNGVVGTLILDPISIDTKLGGLYLKLGKAI